MANQPVKKQGKAQQGAEGKLKADKTSAPTPRLDNELSASPKLRLVANGSRTVNGLRCVRDATMVVTDDDERDFVLITEESRSTGYAQVESVSEAAEVDVALDRVKERGQLSSFATGIRTNVFVRLRSAKVEIEPTLAKILSEAQQDGKNVFRREDVVTAELSLDDVSRVLACPEVAGVEASERVTFHQPLRGQLRTGESNADLAARANGQRQRARAGWPEHRRRRKPKVLVGIIDVGGFDFAHRDFWRSESTRRTRFSSIWDQQGVFRDPPEGFSYGSEIRKEHMLQAVEDAQRVGLRATEIEPQSLMMVESHATHVASIAGGLSGVCPHAELVGVSIHLPTEDEDRRRSFYDSTRIADAVEYLLKVRERRAQELDVALADLPLAINISLGTNGHAHDGSSGVNRWLDHVLSEPGLSVTVAAGNAGQQGPTEPGDLGYMVGRIHTGGRIQAEGLTRDLQWVVPGDGQGDFSENELEIWYEAQDLFSVRIRTPDGTWLPEVGPGQFIENKMINGSMFVSVYSDRFAVSNGANRIAIFLSPFFSATRPTGVAAGTWTVRLKGLEVRDGRYHGWIERDDPRPLGRAGRRELWALPSFFSAGTNVDESSVSSLACGHNVIAVANLDEERSKISITSSQGPTRDGRQKPEVCAAGTDILAASGFDADKQWVAMSGTSMASPLVCGLTAQMLSEQPDLTAPQVQGILRRCAEPLPGSDFQWRNDAGFGPLAFDRIRAEVLALNRMEDLFPRTGPPGSQPLGQHTGEG